MVTLFENLYESMEKKIMDSYKLYMFESGKLNPTKIYHFCEGLCGFSIDSHRNEVTFLQFWEISKMMSCDMTVGVHKSL